MDAEFDIDAEMERRLTPPPVRDRAEAITPVTVLTGFLGAGKTTLVNRILAEDHGLRIAVLVNDFGAVAIDSELIVGVTTNSVSLANGCVCCEVRDDLIAAVESVLDADDEIDAIVLEASGIAEPLGIARTFVDASLQDRLRLDGIIAVVDAEQVPAQVEDPVTAELVYSQIGCSDLVVLNKIDLADRDRVDEVRTFVTELLPNIRIIEATHADVPLRVLVGRRDHDLEPTFGDDPHDHAHGFATWVYQRPQPMDLARLHTVIAQLPGSLYRLKGFTHTVTDPPVRQLVQAVGMRSDIGAYDNWGDRPPSTMLVLIGTIDADRTRIEESLDSALIT